MVSKVKGKRKKRGGTFRSRFPRVYRLGQLVLVLAALWWFRAILLHLLTGEENFSPASLGNLLEGDAKCRESNTNISSLPSAVLMDPLTTEKLRFIGGTGHWFHLIERVLPFVIPAAQTVWRRGAQLRPSFSKADGGAGIKLYIVFQEEAGPAGLDAFGRLVLASMLSGGFYDEVIIGYADVIEEGAMAAGAGARTVTVTNLRKRATLSFHHGSQVGESYSEVVYDQTATANLRSEEGIHRHRPTEDHSTKSGVPKLCVHALMKLTWDATPPKRYMLMGNNTDVYSLLHSSVERTCRLDAMPGANTAPVTARYLYYEDTRRGRRPVGDKFAPLLPSALTRDAETVVVDEQDEGDDLELAQQLGFTTAEIASEKEKKRLLPRDDLSRLPYNLHPYTSSLHSPSKVHTDDTLKSKQQSHRGDKKGAIRKEDPRDERFARKLAKWAAIRNNTDYHFNYNDALWRNQHGGYLYKEGKGMPAGALAEWRSWLRGRAASTAEPATFLPDPPTEGEIARASLAGGLAPSKRATDVPLTVLVYDRDSSRRLRNALEVVEDLKESLQMTDTQRHDYFPLTYTSERAPRKKPHLGIGSIKESRPGGASGLRQGGGNVRRKKGGFVTEHSSVKGYEDGEGKVQWQVELMTHDQHHGFNPHQGHLHDMETGRDTTIEESSHRADATHSKHHPPCNVIRAVREASVLITPHGFTSILLLFQPLKSLLVEVMPYGYNKPEIYGLIQAGMRAFPYGRYRSYLHTESPPTSFAAKALYHARLLGSPYINGVEKHVKLDYEEVEEQINAESWYLDPEERLNATEMAAEIATRFDQEARGGEDALHDQHRVHALNQDSCTANIFCRHIVRDQDVILEPSFQRRLVEFMKSHFVSNKDIHEDVEARSFSGMFGTG